MAIAAAQIHGAVRLMADFRSLKASSDRQRSRT
jgi:hypothetical protein